MQGKNFMLLIHRLGAFSKKDKDNPSQWNDDLAVSEAAKNVGYISTSAIADGALRLANMTENDLDNPDEVFYAFANLGKSSIRAMCERDSYTGVVGTFDGRGYKKEIGTAVQSFFYRDPKDLFRMNEKATKEERDNRKHNEVVLDRYSSGSDEYGGRLQPSHIVVFTDNVAKIGDLPKKHADYFGVPIIMIDPEKYK